MALAAYRLASRYTFALAFVVVLGGGLLSAGILVLGGQTAYQYLGAPALVALMAAAYLAATRWFKGNGRPLYMSLSWARTDALLAAFAALFYLIMTLAFISLARSDTPYVRPPFILAAAIAAAMVIAVQVMLAGSRPKWTAIILLQILLLAASLRVVPLLLSPELIGIDPFFHRTIVLDLMADGTLPSTTYESFGVSHILTAVSWHVLGLDYTAAVIVAITVPALLGSLFVYVLAKSLWNRTVGLMAALITAVASFSIDLAVSPRPVSLTIVLIPLLLWLLFGKKPYSIAGSFGALLLGGAVILIHTVGALAAATAVGIFWLVSRLYSLDPKAAPRREPTLGFVLLFVVAMVAWWVYSTDFAVVWIGELIKNAFDLDRDPWIITSAAAEYLGEHKVEQLLSALSFGLLVSLAMVGAFAILPRDRQGQRSSLAVTGLAVAGLAGLFAVAGLTGFHVARWYPTSEVLLAAVAAVGILAIAAVSGGHALRIAAATGVIGLFAFLSITSTFGSRDQDFYLSDLSARYTFYPSETAAALTVNEVYEGSVWTDRNYADYVAKWAPFASGAVKGVNATDQLLARTYAEVNGLLMVRKEIVEEPFFVGGGVARLSGDPGADLDELNWPKVYDSNGVSIWAAPGGR